MGLLNEFVPGATTAALLVAFAGVVGYVAVTGPGSLGDGGLNETEVERLVVEETNQLRVENGLERVEVNESLRKAARGHASRMARGGFVAHEAPDSIPYDRYGWCANRGGYFGENVANTWYDRNIVYEEGDAPTLHLSTEREVAEHLVRQWNDSTGHRRTMLGENWTRIGVGITVADNNEVFAVQAFCSDKLVADAP
ncbi:MAG: CAP domain-containing protein [Halobacteriales archaeon]